MPANYVSLGCASMLGRYGKKDSIAILEYAYERGICHFDVARSYGYGEAESLLGRTISSKANVKVSTKFGIVPSRKAKIFSFAKPLVRPFIKKTSPQSLDIDYENNTLIDEALLSRSFERSLKALRLEKIDKLFIHEPRSNWVISGELIHALEELKHRGLITEWGVSGYLESIAKLTTINHQIPNIQSSLNILNCQELPCAINSAFSPFHRGFVLETLANLRKNESFVNEFNQETGLDFNSHTDAFWAISLLNKAINIPIVLATNRKSALDESLSAMSFGGELDKNATLNALNIIGKHYDG